MSTNQSSFYAGTTRIRIIMITQPLFSESHKSYNSQNGFGGKATINFADGSNSEWNYFYNNLTGKTLFLLTSEQVENDLPYEYTYLYRVDFADKLIRFSIVSVDFHVPPDTFTDTMAHNFRRMVQEIYDKC